MTRTLLAAAAALFLSSLNAVAAPYVGVDLNANLLDLNSNNSFNTPETTIGPDFHVGYRFNNLNLAGELGYGTNRGEQTPDNLRMDMLTADGIYYVRLGGFVNLLFTAGMAEMNYGDSTATYSVYQVNGITKTSRQGNTVFHGDEFDWRGGGGLSFALTDGYEIHFIGRYQPVSMHGMANYSLGLDFGMNFYF